MYHINLMYFVKCTDVWSRQLVCSCLSIHSRQAIYPFVFPLTKDLKHMEINMKIYLYQKFISVNIVQDFQESLSHHRSSQSITSETFWLTKTDFLICCPITMLLCLLMQFTDSSLRHPRILCFIFKIMYQLNLN